MAEPARTKSDLYERDFAAWLDEQVDAARRGRIDLLDLEHIAEELEGMAARDRRELKSRLTILYAHLLKWQFQPERRSDSWRATIQTQRNEIEYILEDSPSLRRYLVEQTGQCYNRACRAAADETDLGHSAFPETPIDPERALDPSFWPE